MTTSLRVVRPASFPALTARWTVNALGALPPEEVLATCDSCVQLPPTGEPAGPQHFNPRTKCCTYLPVLYNFQAGALLDVPSVEARIAAGKGVTPLGLEGDEEFVKQYDQSRFGRDLTLRCPHYLEESGRCGVWEHRNATCTTWFCRCDRGAQSFAFWRHGLQRLLRLIEDTVADWAIFSLGANGSDFGPHGEPRAFYRACAHVAEECSWRQIVSLGGSDLRDAIQEARTLHEALLAAPLHPTGLPGRSSTER